ncbi:MAG: DUF2334 domain-containing protein [Polyangiaceae bacterium]|nr:DUF2334 domain-containing protein [Polyangiaceae bacterium]
MASRLVVRFDDIAPNMAWPTFERVIEICERYGVYPLLGVIPDNRDPELLAYPRREDFWSVVRDLQGRGWGVAQHGFQHVIRSRMGGLFGVNGFRSEFAGVPISEQRECVSVGAAVLRSAGLHIEAFMAPWHSFDLATVAALKEADIFAVTDGYSSFPVEYGGVLLVPQMTERVLPVPWGVQTVCYHWNAATEGSLRDFERFCAKNQARLVPFRDVLGGGLGAALGTVDRCAGRAALAALRARRRFFQLYDK